MRILIVEDDVLIGMLIEDMTRTLGHKPVGPVATLAEAMGLLDSCDFAILDVKLPDGESYPVADALKRREVPFCFSSGHGCAEYLGSKNLPKPFDLPDLERVLEPHLNK